MTHEQFWRLIDQARAQSAGDHDVLNEQLEEQLLDLPPEEIIGFQRILDQLMEVSYRWDLWGVAYLMNGGCSDDEFVYFRAWLISQGAKLFEAALADADGALAAVFDPNEEGAYENEGFLFAAHTAYETKTDRDLFEDAALDNAHRNHDAEPAGQPWPEDEEVLARRFPKTYRKLTDG